MRVGIVGSGPVGQKLGDAFILTGHAVMIGTRNPVKIHSWVSKHPKGKASIGSFDQAATFGDMAVIATLWEGTQAALKAANPKNLAGKVVIDVTNPLDFSEKTPRLAIGHVNSAGETVQKLLPKAKVVKAFNIIGNGDMFQPKFPGGPPTMFICGNDEDAKVEVSKILDSFGWEIVDIGNIEGSRLLESLAMLWISHYVRTGSADHAFKLLRR
ncbi:MAG: NADPH-dependent F420 reductase [Nitrososphaera sp.]